MPPFPPQPVQVNCPNCGSSIRTGIYTVVDVTQQPELKQALLGGQLNVALCQNCGTGSMLGAPMVYHDAEKQLCLIYFPQELNASPEEQEHFIGETTGAIIRSLPPDAPRAHLLNPRRFLSLPSLLDVVLEAEGISREMLEGQRRRVELISELASALDEEQRFAGLAEQYKDELDDDFFATLQAFLAASAQEGRQDSVEILQRLLDQLIAATGYRFPGEEDIPDLAEVLERLVNVSDEELDQTIAELRPEIDYAFFESWTAKIEEFEQQGNSAEAQRLTERRARILATIEEMDREAQAMFEAGNTVLRAVIDAEDLRAALEAQGTAVDEAFMLVLDANLAAAERAGQAEAVQRLLQIRETAIAVIQDRMTPEDRLINELLMAETARESTQLLRQHVAKITPDLVKKLNEVADMQEKRGAADQSERLRQLAREAGAMLF
jgi:hypothetical protein